MKNEIFPSLLLWINNKITVLLDVIDLADDWKDEDEAEFNLSNLATVYIILMPFSAFFLLLSLSNVWPFSNVKDMCKDLFLDWIPELTSKQIAPKKFKSNDLKST